MLSWLAPRYCLGAGKHIILAQSRIVSWRAPMARAKIEILARQETILVRAKLIMPRYSLGARQDQVLTRAARRDAILARDNILSWHSPRCYLDARQDIVVRAKIQFWPSPRYFVGASQITIVGCAKIVSCRTPGYNRCACQDDIAARAKIVCKCQPR